MKVITIEDAPILTPNPEHKNFTATEYIIPKGTEIFGEVKKIDGLRKGKPFQYRLFYTNNKQIIYTNKIKPTNMEKTEVTLSAEGQKDPTVISVPKNTMDRNAMYGIIIGAVAGFGYSAYKNKGAKEKLMFSAIGAALGFIAGKVITKRKAITVKN